MTGRGEGAAATDGDEMEVLGGRGDRAVNGMCGYTHKSKIGMWVYLIGTAWYGCLRRRKGRRVEWGRRGVVGCVKEGIKRTMDQSHPI